MANRTPLSGVGWVIARYYPTFLAFGLETFVLDEKYSFIQLGAQQ